MSNRVDVNFANDDWDGLRDTLRRLAAEPDNTYSDNTERQTGDFVNFVYQRAATIPATPTEDGIPTGWSDAPPAGSDPLWMSKSFQRSDGALIGTWSTPVRQGATTTISVDNNIAQWKLNDNAANTTVADSSGNSHTGTASSNTSTLTAASKASSNLVSAFDLGGTDEITISDHNDFTFSDGSDDTAFSIAGWANVALHNAVQVICSKWKDGSTIEWRLSLNSDEKLQLHLADTSGDLTENWIAQWKLNETGASPTLDNAETTSALDATLSVNADTVTASGATVNTGTSLDFGGTVFATVPDNAALSFGNGSADSPFSIGAWVFVTDGGSQFIASKFDNSGREWEFFLNADETLRFRLTDESENAEIFTDTDSALSTGVWHFVVATYSGVGGASANDGMTIYVDGSAVATTNGDNGNTYVAMEALGEDMLIGGRSPTTGPIGLFADKIDNVMLFGEELTLSKVQTLWNSGAGTEDISGATPTPFAVTDDAISTGWHLFAATYDATGGATAANGIILYVDGVAVASTVTNDADYVAMQNTNSDVLLGASLDSGGSAESFWQDKLDNVMVFGDVLTTEDIDYLYNSGNGTEVLTGTNLTTQFSSDASSWHDDYVTGDLYMRQKTEGGEFGPEIQVVGEGTSGIVDTVHIKADAVTANEINANTITANEIFANTITFTELRQTGGSEAVDTDAIRDIATTITGLSKTDGSVTLPFLTFVPIASVTVTSEGNVIEISLSFTVAASGTAIGSFRFKRDAVVLKTWSFTDPIPAGDEFINLSQLDVPGSGSVTYIVEGTRSTSFGVVSASLRFLYLKEFKK